MTVKFPSNSQRTSISGASGTVVYIFAGRYPDATRPTITDLSSVAIPTATLTLDSNRLLPQFLAPDGTTILYAADSPSSPYRVTLTPYAAPSAALDAPNTFDTW